MRTVFACILLFVLPPLAVVGYRHYGPFHGQPQPVENRPAGPVGPGEVLFFNATWCGPCRQMKPIVAQLRRQGYRLRDVDVDKNRALANKYGIRAVPTFVFVEQGSEVKRFSGGTSADQLKKLCASSAYRL